MAQQLCICLKCGAELTKEEAQYHKQNQYDNGKCYTDKPCKKRYIEFEEDY